MKLKDACISRDGLEDGTDTFNQIVADCGEVINLGSYDEVEAILFDEGFEPDYIMDIIEIFS